MPLFSFLSIDCFEYILKETEAKYLAGTSVELVKLAKAEGVLKEVTTLIAFDTPSEELQALADNFNIVDL